MREVDWMNGSRHNKNANRQIDSEISAFIREKNMFSPLSPKLQIFGVDYYWSFEAQKMVFGPALVLSKHVQSTKCEETGFPMSWHTVVLWLPLQQSNTASPQSTASSEIHVALCKHQARNTHAHTCRAPHPSVIVLLSVASQLTPCRNFTVHFINLNIRAKKPPPTGRGCVSKSESLVDELISDSIRILPQSGAFCIHKCPSFT